MLAQGTSIQAEVASEKIPFSNVHLGSQRLDRNVKVGELGQ